MLWSFTSSLHPVKLLNVVTFHVQLASTTNTECCDLSHPAFMYYHYRMLWPVTPSLHPLPLLNVETFHIHPPSTTTTECCDLSHPAFIHYHTERCDLSHPSSIHYHYQMLWHFTPSLHALPLPNAVTFHIQPSSTTTTEYSDLSRAACIHADPRVRLGSSGTCRCRRAVWSCCWSSLLLCGWGGRQSQTLSSLYSGGCRSLDARHILIPALEEKEASC